MSLKEAVSDNKYCFGAIDDLIDWPHIRKGEAQRLACSHCRVNAKSWHRPALVSCLVLICLLPRSHLGSVYAKTDLALMQGALAASGQG